MQSWSFAGNGDRDDVSEFTFQPIVNYLVGAWYRHRRATDLPVVDAVVDHRRRRAQLVFARAQIAGVGGGQGRARHSLHLPRSRLLLLLRKQQVER